MRRLAVIALAAVLLAPDVRAQTDDKQITLSPNVVRGGMVVTAEGTGFDAGTTLVLRWDRGTGPEDGTEVTAGDDGTFTARVLVFPNDATGERHLTNAVPGALQLTSVRSSPVLVVKRRTLPRR